GYPPVNPAQEKIHMSDPQSVLPAVQQMPDTVTVSKETLKKVSNVLASGARLLRSLEREGNESDRLAGAARVGRLRTKLSPVVEMARAAVIEARALAGSSAIELEKLLAMRGRVPLPNHDDSTVTTAWQVLVTAYDMVTTGIDSIHRLLQQGEQ